MYIKQKFINVFVINIILNKLIILKLKDNIIIDGTEFVEIADTHHPNIIMKEIRDSLYPQVIDNNYVKCFGYKFNIKSTIYVDAIPQELIKGWNTIIDLGKSIDILDSFF